MSQHVVCPSTNFIVRSTRYLSVDKYHRQQKNPSYGTIDGEFNSLVVMSTCLSVDKLFPANKEFWRALTRLLAEHSSQQQQQPSTIDQDHEPWLGGCRYSRWRGRWQPLCYCIYSATELARIWQRQYYHL